MYIHTLYCIYIKYINCYYYYYPERPGPEGGPRGGRQADEGGPDGEAPGLLCHAIICYTTSILCCTILYYTIFSAEIRRPPARFFLFEKGWSSPKTTAGAPDTQPHEDPSR